MVGVGGAESDPRGRFRLRCPHLPRTPGAAKALAQEGALQADQGNAPLYSWKTFRLTSQTSEVRLQLLFSFTPLICHDSPGVSLVRHSYSWEGSWLSPQMSVVRRSAKIKG